SLRIRASSSSSDGRSAWARVAPGKPVPHRSRSAPNASYTALTSGYVSRYGYFFDGDRTDSSDTLTYTFGYFARARRFFVPPPPPFPPPSPRARCPPPPRTSGNRLPIVSTFGNCSAAMKKLNTAPSSSAFFQRAWCALLSSQSSLPL